MTSHRRLPGLLLIGLALALSSPKGAAAQAYGSPDRAAPGDAMIQAYLANESAKIHARFADDLASLEKWQERRDTLKQEYFHMLGLWPLPEKTPLKATVTGTIDGDGYAVEMLHYQSVPGLYVTANLYRPAKPAEGARCPAVLYVCGHSGRGRNGNKTAFQSHGIWFARHGYVCLVVDTLQLGEIAATHHGTYNHERWWWHSRGYTSAGVECWNGVRGIDYLVSRDDVDAERIAVTGISGGGAATFWVACADERVKVAVPVSGMADLPSYVSNRVINGHCDCMFLYNTFQWPWARIAALFAPRPMLFTNSDNDPIFPMDANERIINRLERVYSLYGAGDQVDSLVSIGGHAYRKDIRQGAARFINTHLKGDPAEVADTEIDLAPDRDGAGHPIAPEKLRVFPTDDDLPKDELNTTIDEHFVPMAKVNLPAKGKFEAWKNELQNELRRVTFGALPDRIPAAQKKHESDKGIVTLQTEENIAIRLRDATKQALAGADASQQPKRVTLILVSESLDEAQVSEAVRSTLRKGDRVYLCEPRGIGATRWTRRNPPNYVERSHVLLGRTVDTGRIWDAIAAARYLKSQHKDASLHLAGEEGAALWAAYAALWEDDIDGVILNKPLLTHMDAQAPQLLNVLRVCDAPDALGMLAPRPLVLIDIEDSAPLEKIRKIYEAAGASEKLRTMDSP